MRAVKVKLVVFDVCPIPWGLKNTHVSTTVVCYLWHMRSGRIMPSEVLPYPQSFTRISSPRRGPSNSRCCVSPHLSNEWDTGGSVWLHVYSSWSVCNRDETGFSGFCSRSLKKSLNPVDICNNAYGWFMVRHMTPFDERHLWTQK